MIAKWVGTEDEVEVEEGDEDDEDDEEEEVSASWRMVVGVRPDPLASAPSLGFRVRNAGRVAIPRTMFRRAFFIITALQRSISKCIRKNLTTRYIPIG